MKHVQRGFTLIELVMVIVILGVLAAVALPRFANLQGEANAAATQGVAGALSSASSINFSTRSLNAANGVAVDNCNDVPGALQVGLPAGYQVTAAAVAVNVTVTCTLTNTNPDPSVTATYSAIGIN